MKYFLLILFIFLSSNVFANNLDYYLAGTKIVLGKKSNYKIIKDIKFSKLQILHVRQINNNECTFLDHVEVNGSINPDAPFVIKKILSEIRDNLIRCNKNHVIKVYLNSGGGYLYDGLELGRIFREFNVSINISEYCMSSCATAFLGGKYRDMSQKNMIMFHAPYNLIRNNLNKIDISCQKNNKTLKKYYGEMTDIKTGNYLYRRTMDYCGVQDGWVLNKDAAKIMNILKPEPSRFISLTIEIDNRCSVSDNYFSVRVPGTNLSVPFKNRKVRLRLLRSRKVQLTNNPNNIDKSFEYNGIHVPIEKKMVLTADCTSSPRLKGIFGDIKN